MRVLLTGHKGYIGTILAPMLKQAGHEVVGLDSDIFKRCTFGEEPEAFPDVDHFVLHQPSEAEIRQILQSAGADPARAVYTHSLYGNTASAQETCAAPAQHAQHRAVDPFGRMEKKGRRSGRSHGRRNFLADQAGFAHPGHDHLALAAEDDLNRPGKIAIDP